MPYLWPSRERRTQRFPG